MRNTPYRANDEIGEQGATQAFIEDGQQYLMFKQCTSSENDYALPIFYLAPGAALLEAEVALARRAFKRKERPCCACNGLVLKLSNDSPELRSLPPRKQRTLFLREQLMASAVLMLVSSSSLLVPIPVQRSRTHPMMMASPITLADERGNLALLDEKAMLDAQHFAFTPEDLIAKAKDFIAADYGADDTSMLADDFTFIGPFVGPLTKQQYVEALGGNLNPSEGFPDLIGRQFGFMADPVEPGRVWWISRPVGTFTKPFFGAEPDGRRIETPPQSMGCVFNAAGKVTRINVGAVIDRTQGNTAGLGGLFGFLWFVGKAPPAPEYQPYQQSWQFALLSRLAPVLTKLQEQQNK